LPNLADHLLRQARRRGSKHAIVFEDTHFSSAEVAARSLRIAGNLSELGVTIGSRVGLMMHSKPEFIFYQHAVFILGAILSPMNICYRGSEIAHAIKSCDLEFLIIDREFLDRLPAAGAPGTETLKKIFAFNLPAEQQTEWLIAVDGLATTTSPLDDAVNMPIESTALMLSTSATTGKAKGVMLSIANIRANYDRTPGWLGIDDSSIILCALPLYNTFGLNQCINATMVTGATLVLLPRFDADKCFAAIKRHGCTFFPAVPTMLQKLFDLAKESKSGLTSINLIMTGAASVPATLLEHVRRLTGPETVVFTGFGLPEATALVTLGRVELDDGGKVARPKSIGRVLPGMEMKIATETGEVAKPGEVGEICLRGPNIMKGYYKQPAETHEAIVDGWLRTGDLATFDGEGYAYIVDRKKDVIIRGGQNIYPVDIEEVIYRHASVIEAVVIGVADAVLGEVPVAYVVTRPGASLEQDELIALCQQELAYFKIPTAIHFLSELPKGPTGKIMKRALRVQ
jgi:long-chain acyl-CoA synthetase